VWRRRGHGCGGGWPRIRFGRYESLILRFKDDRAHLCGERSPELVSVVTTKTPRFMRSPNEELTLAEQGRLRRGLSGLASERGAHCPWKDLRCTQNSFRWVYRPLLGGSVVSRDSR